MPVGPPGNRGKEGYNPDVVSLFGNDIPPASTEGGKASQRGKEGYNPDVGKSLRLRVDRHRCVGL